MSKHTPGPWMIHDVDHRYQPIHVRADDCQKLVAEVGSQVDYRREDDAPNARLLAAAPDLLAALEDLVSLDKRQDETHNESFERLAERFERDTGMLSPGKSQAAALCGTPTMDERKAVHEKWYAAFFDRARAAIAKTKGETE